MPVTITTGDINAGRDVRVSVADGGDDSVVGDTFARIAVLALAANQKPDAIEEEVNRATGWFAMVPDVLDVAVAALNGPLTAAGMVARKIGDRIRIEYRKKEETK